MHLTTAAVPAPALNGAAADDPRPRTAPTTSVRVLYADLHGVARGKDVPVGMFDHAVASGLCFCSAVMGTDLRHTPVRGGDEGYPDLVAHPDVRTMAALPWDPGVAVCLADLEPAAGGAPIANPRGAVRRASAALEALGLSPVVGPELEFFLVRRDPSAEHGVARRVDHPSMVYTVGAQADPDGLVRGMTEDLAALGLGVFAVNHEFMNSQYEINLRHADALTAADRAFLLKVAAKDIAARHGLVATFMGKPFNDQGGSGTHLHLSLDRAGDNAFDAPDDADGVSGELRQFVAGVLAHAPALMAFLNPTINAFRRLQPDSLAPTRANWGWDNRSTFIRIPPERGRAARIEIRVGDGAANPYLAIAAVLAAGTDGLRRRLEPPAPVLGDAYRADPAADDALPTCLEDALDALEADTVLRDALGPEIVDTFLSVKRFEIERHRAWVSDWEIDEYLHHL
ncbi:glutamine synthetase family protein [Patulibacter sp. SYSU D01012]|uniref:glutamine synthetase family protein n=1 Tax=Patulibacter sp. SYSU D01012 TaxID=2817381 RepID=UPI001B306DC1|nr:glutamine synthetase family protein [Patulibacter sp. SYSU D01012]